MDPKLLALVRCPVTHSKLEYADDTLIKQLNEKMAQKELFNRVGQAIENPLSEGLVNEDQTLLLPIRNGIAIMVPDQAIVLG